MDEYLSPLEPTKVNTPSSTIEEPQVIQSNQEEDLLTSATSSIWGFATSAFYTIKDSSNEFITTLTNETEETFNTLDDMSNKESHILDVKSDDIEIKSNEARETNNIDQPKDDLTEMNSIDNTVSAALHNIQESVAYHTIHDSVASIGGSVLATTFDFLGVSLADDDDEIDNENIESQPNLSKLSIQTIAIESNELTFTTDPKGDFSSYLNSFDISDFHDSIESVLASKPIVKSFFEDLVPEPISAELFWARYFYRVNQLNSPPLVKPESPKLHVADETRKEEEVKTSNLLGAILDEPMIKVDQTLSPPNLNADKTSNDGWENVDKPKSSIKEDDWSSWE